MYDAVCFLPIVLWSTGKNTYNSIPFCQASETLPSLSSTKDAAYVARQDIVHVVVKQEAKIKLNFEDFSSYKNNKMCLNWITSFTDIELYTVCVGENSELFLQN